MCIEVQIGKSEGSHRQVYGVVGCWESRSQEFGNLGGVTGCQHKQLFPCDPRFLWRVFIVEELAGAMHVFNQRPVELRSSFRRVYLLVHRLRHISQDTFAKFIGLQKNFMGGVVFSWGATRSRIGTFRRHHGFWVWPSMRTWVSRSRDVSATRCPGRVCGWHMQRAGRIVQDVSAIP